MEQWRALNELDAVSGRDHHQGVCMAVWEIDPVVVMETIETLRHRPEWLGRLILINSLH